MTIRTFIVVAAFGSVLAGAATDAAAYDTNGDGEEDAKDCLAAAKAHFQNSTYIWGGSVQAGYNYLTTDSSNWWSYAQVSTPADHCRQYAYFLVANPSVRSSWVAAEWNSGKGNAEWCSHSSIDYGVFSIRADGSDWYVAGGGLKYGASTSSVEQYYGGCTYHTWNPVGHGQEAVFVPSADPNVCGGRSWNVYHIIAIKAWSHNHAAPTTTDCNAASCYHPVRAYVVGGETSNACF